MVFLSEELFVNLNVTDLKGFIRLVMKKDINVRQTKLLNYLKLGV